MFIGKRTVLAARPTDFEVLDERQLRRLLRSVNISTDLDDDKELLLQALRFHMDCDDNFFDNDVVPNKLKRYQLAQALVSANSTLYELYTHSAY